MPANPPEEPVKNQELRQTQSFQQAKRGSREAFDDLFSAHAAPLRLYVRFRMGRKLRSAMESMDFVQEVYLQAYEGFQGFEGKNARDLYRWLCGIANHRMSDERRKLEAVKRGGEARFEKELDSSLGAPIEKAPADRPGPRTIAALKEDGAKMEETFMRLSEKDQEVIGWRQFEGLSSKETGEKMGLSESAVNVLYFRAMNRWRELLGK